MIEARTSWLRAGLLSRCPRCGKGPLFDGYLTIAPCCSICDLDFSPVDTGDGPAVFIILIVGFVVVAGALILELAFSPPYWVHLVVWSTVTIGLSLAALRPFKATLVALQHKHQAGEARLLD